MDQMSETTFQIQKLVAFTSEEFSGTHISHVVTEVVDLDVILQDDPEEIRLRITPALEAKLNEDNCNTQFQSSKV